eukprot:14607871-Alexandrium_andersonii.AAC.1
MGRRSKYAFAGPTGQRQRTGPHHSPRLALFSGSVSAARNRRKAAPRPSVDLFVGGAARSVVLPAPGSG